MHPHTKTSNCTETSVFAGGPGEVGPAGDLVAKAVARLRVVPEQPGGEQGSFSTQGGTCGAGSHGETSMASVQHSEASIALMRLAAVAHRESNSAPEMDRLPGVMSEMFAAPQASITAQQVLRQRSVSLPMGLVVEGVPALRWEGLPHRTVSEGESSRGLEELLSSVLLQQVAEEGSTGVEAVGPVGCGLWRVATVAGHENNT